MHRIGHGKVAYLNSVSIGTRRQIPCQVTVTKCIIEFQKMLAYCPAERINIRDALFHDYFSDMDTSDLPAKDEEKLSCPKHIYQFYLLSGNNMADLPIVD